MTATLRVVLDQLVSPTSRDLAEASRALTNALIATAPRGADVAGIIPRGEDPAVDGLVDLSRLGLPRRELAASWQLGMAPGVGKGMIHSPTLLAPLVRHDRVNETHQVVVTLWDLRAWEAPEALSRPEVMWHRAMLKRAERYADAVVVPTHAMADALAGIAPRLAGRIRVIAGAAPEGFRVPTDVAGRLRSLDLPGTFVATAGGAAASDGLAPAFAGIVGAGWDGDVVVLDCPDGEEPAVVELAAAAGVPEARVHVRGSLEPFDRAAVHGSASMFLAPSERSDWPWRAVEAITTGTPVVAADSPAHREVLADSAATASPAGFGDAISSALGERSEVLRVHASDRARAFSWVSGAERIWQLHAEL
ncbi:MULTISPECIES: glycosyltransferase [Microbacterium]|uniref:Glycosyltransferase n=1 Tax=Microbacterium wangchenii TaxID=2541726 RepID=A0ABX5ST97_9MICO|nr:MULTISPECIES: glycosyltransferase [Microbacterium]MCK6066755.1 glycosyltransferase [Microbacterium sp. EYE_512]QBR88074.1 glycosyltransferase [Microbacterium wangchenii]TXK18136.1 glycosyltransferase family 4 protein [Microbacterium wangchenii]